jgi:hypothetical protein
VVRHLLSENHSGRSNMMRRVEGLALLALVAVVVVVIVTRHTPNSPTKAPAQSAAARSPVAQTTTPTTTPTPAVPRAQTLPKLQQAATVATQANFKATYQARGSATTLVFAKIGSRSSFVTGTTALYTNGGSNTVCDTSSGRPSCYTGAQAPTGLLSVVDPTQESQAVHAAAAAGTSVSYTVEHRGGQQSLCMAYSQSGQPVKYCIGDVGVVTYLKIPSGTFELAGYTTQVTSADVSVPADATILPAQ